jgi:predicted kinase
MPKLILVCGTPFAGKSTLARRLADRFGYPEIDVDATKAGLFGEGVADDALDRSDWERVYRESDRRIADHLAAGRSVVDASRSFRKAERDAARAICRVHGANLVTVHVDTPEDIVRQRLLANRRSRERRDLTDEGFAVILAGWEPPTADERPLVFRFGDDADEWIGRNAGAIADA